ncbi:MAG TPA: Rieske 2Fe-2S domain-containing protein [Geminicoccus sp.]|uniref:Rieske 2Fe-2S domain-containing protein n=1 Tax=Geminicoccus sp. TaxID=2024832 RepID=UPI002E2F9016|nr:Rieske 2Fe-2S domain-containing protein [Geminicoccus sp.]HEX2527237.1 Rieske 2Fe-2S domain-containing protein [Geminicoccus sp.]
MSVRYTPVGWNRNKAIYDGVLVASVAAYLLLYLPVAPAFQDLTRPLDGPTLRMQAFGSAAFLMLSMVLAIGPLARLDRRFLPLLYNRRHFGVLTFVVALTHAGQVLGWYFDFGVADPYVALLGTNTSYGQVLGFPFELFGILALVVLAVLAVTSHDFWLNFLTPPLWKTMHMGVYAAYAAVILHVVLGRLQSGQNPLLAVLVAASVAILSVLHVLAGRRERARDLAGVPVVDPPWVDAGSVDAIAEGRAVVVPLPGDERVAVFRHKGRLSAVSNLCAHQNGPLGEGKVIGGCITCPWHGFTYRLADGRAPAPYTEKLATYRLKLDGRRVLLDPRANPPGTYVEPIPIPET